MSSDYPDDTLEQLAEYLRLNPEATTPEALGATNADPSVWGDVLEDALDDAEPHTAIATIAPSGLDEGGDDDTDGDRSDGSNQSRAPREGEKLVRSRGRWEAADFTDPTPGIWTAERLGREQWMGHVEKRPFAPWGDRDHPDAEAEEDARWKWGIRENYIDGETIAVAEDDPRLDGRVFIQREDDPYAFVDGDGVRCPETGEAHPAFVAVLNHLGLTYADISTSGSGAHANYRGALPEGVKQVTFALDDEPWGANDDVPEIEIYDGKHVCVATGEHVPGTPTEIREWDDDALREILDEYDQLPADPVDVDAEREAFDATDYDADATTAEETTDDIRDCFAALDRLDARYVAEKTIVHRWNDDASTSDGKRAFVPTWGRGANGTANVVDDCIWQDTGGGGYGGPVAMALIELGELRPDTATPGGRGGEQWFRGYERLRELGFDLPEYETSTDVRGDVDHTAVLPPAVRDLTTAASGWDWRHAAAQNDGTLTIEDARERTVDAISDAYESGDRVLIEAPPTTGKTFGSIKAVAVTGEQITILTGRGHKEQYAQIREWCDEHGLSHYTLPSFTRDCDTANGENGEEWKDKVRGWHNQDATPKEIHKAAEYVLGHPLPCQKHDEQRCPYTSKWDFDPDNYDVLIGHYTHAYNEKVTTGRTPVLDEFPDAFETELGREHQGAISYWLKMTDGVPFDNYTDLIEHRDDQSRRADALLWFDEHGVEPDETHVFDDRNAHAAAPLAVFTLLASDDLGNGFERAEIEDVGHGVFDREEGKVTILQPPNLEYASGIVALDGTPTKRMWEIALGERLNHRPVLQDAERAEYIRDALNLNLVRTTDAVKSYTPGTEEIASRVSLAEDTALLEGIRDTHGQRAALITTARAEQHYENEGVLELVDDVQHYGNVLGSNKFAETRLGAVFGSNNYGPNYVKKWGAYLGESITPTFPCPENDFTPTDYGPIGNQIRTHMREHETLQAAMRFGRDGNGAVVYVHTNTLPEWVPLAGEGRVVKTWSDGMRDVLGAMEELERATTAAIAEHPAVDLTHRQVFNHLENLRERGVLSRNQDAEDGRRVVWRDDGLHRVGEHGDVELEPVDLEDLNDDEVAEMARSSIIYRWGFRNLGVEDDDSLVDRSLGASDPPRSAADGGDPPPDEAD